MEITGSQFEELLESGKPFVVDFWAEWCGPCRMIAPMVEQMSAEFAGRVAIVKINVDSNRDLPVRYSVRNIPTLLFFKGGELAQRHVGALTREEFRAKVEALLA